MLKHYDDCYDPYVCKTIQFDIIPEPYFMF
jgi:hypothetical protein